MSFALSDLLTVVIVASPSRIHPQTDLIDEAISSVEAFVLGPNSDVPFVLSHDGPVRLSARQLLDYDAYLRTLKKKYKGTPKRVVTLEAWGHISGSLKESLALVSTPFVLVCQHDFKFTRSVPIVDLLELMAVNPEVKHVRFNKAANEPYDYDLFPGKRRDFYQQVDYHLPRGRLLSLIKTLGWSDNNHLCRANYYTNVVFPLVGNRRIPPEHACNPASRESLHGFFGTYIFGGLGDEAAIQHLDGRHPSTPEFGPHFFTRMDVDGRSLKSRIVRRFWLGWLRCKNLGEKWFFTYKAQSLVRASRRTPCTEKSSTTSA